MFPMEIASRQPEWWGQPSDEESLNAHEPELLSEQLADLLGKPVPVRYEKLFTSNDGPELLRKLPAHLAQDGVTALVFNFIDQLTHGRSESAILYEVARDADALRGLTRTWFERSPVRAALAEAERFFVYPTKLREYQARYRGSFLHGGVTPEEMILPVALLTPRGRTGSSGGGR